MARRLPEFTYDPKVCRFKTWLLNLVRWRIQDQIRKRRRTEGLADGVPALPSNDTSTATIERIPDLTIPEFGAEWDAAWERNLFARAMERVREQINERQFQVFDLLISKEWPAADVAQTLGISVARVYLTKHRVSALLKREVRHLERLTAGLLASASKVQKS